MDNAIMPTLAECAERVRLAMQSIKQNIIDIGVWLLKAKELLPHGDFGNWLKDNFNMTQQSAENYMRVAENFGNNAKIKNVFDFQPSALIELAKLPPADIERFTASVPNATTLSVRKLRRAIHNWKQSARTQTFIQNKLTTVEEFPAVTSQTASNYDALKLENARLRSDIAELQSAVSMLNKIINEQLETIVEKQIFGAEYFETILTSVEPPPVNLVQNCAKRGNFVHCGRGVLGAINFQSLSPVLAVLGEKKRPFKEAVYK